MRFFLLHLKIFICCIFVFSYTIYSAFAQTHEISSDRSVAVREGPGSSFKIVGRLESNSKLHVVEQQDDWYRVTADNLDFFWVHKGYITEIESCNFSNHIAPPSIPKDGLVLVGHKRPVTSVAFDTLNRFAATGSIDGEIRIWNLNSGQTIQLLNGRGPVTSISFSNDGSELLSVDSDGPKLWDIDKSCSVKGIYKGVHGNSVNQAIFSRANSNIITNEVGVPLFFDKKTKKPDWGRREQFIEKYSLSEHSEVIFSKSSDFFILKPDLWRRGSPAKFHIFSTHRDDLHWSFDLKIKQENISLFQINENSGIAVFLSKESSSTESSILRAINTKNGEMIFEYTSPHYISDFHFVKGGKNLLLIENGILSEWDISNKEKIGRSSFYGDAIISSTQSNNGQWLLTGTENNIAYIRPYRGREIYSESKLVKLESYETPSGKNTSEVERRGAWRLVKLDTGEEKWILSSFLQKSLDEDVLKQKNRNFNKIYILPQISNPINSNVISFENKENKLFEGTQSRIVNVWDIRTKSLQGYIDTYIDGLDIKHIDASGESVKIWGTEQAGEYRNFLITADKESFNIITRKVFTLNDHHNIDIIDDKIVFSNEWGYIKELDINTGKTILEYRSDKLLKIEAKYSSDGKYVVAVGHKGIEIYESITGKPIYQNYLDEGNYENPIYDEERSLLLFKKWDIDKKNHEILISYTNRDGGIYTLNPNIEVTDLEVDFGEELAIMGGSDGIFQIWDIGEKKKIHQSHNTKSYIVDISINSDAGEIAILGEERELFVVNKKDYNYNSDLSVSYMVPMGVAFSNDGDHLIVDYRFSPLEAPKVAYWNLKRGILHDRRSDDKQPKFDVESVFGDSFWVTNRRSYYEPNFATDFWRSSTTNDPASYFDSQFVGEITPDGTTNLLGDPQKIELLLDSRNTSEEFLSTHNRPLTGLSIDHIYKDLRVASSSFDGTVRLWNVSTGKEVAIFSLFEDGSWIILTPEGYFNAGNGGQKNLRVIRNNKVLSLDRVYDALFRPDLVLEALRGDPEGKLKKASKQLDINTILDGGAPPIINKINIDGGKNTSQEKIDVIINLSIRNGGIGRLEIKVNGATQIIEYVPRTAPDQKTIDISQSVFLTSGKNQIEVTAYNQANQIASDSNIVEVTSTAPPQEKKVLHILAVGVDKYEDQKITQLNYAVNDANAIGDAFTKIGGNIYEDIKLTKVLNSEATKENLDKVFSKIGAQTRPEDVFVFFLSGHGKTENGRYYFLPPNFRYEGNHSFAESGIGQLQWQRWMAKVPAQKSILLYDTCESGSLTRDQANEGLEVKAAIDRMARATGRTILTAATDTEPALEGYGGHGVFSYLVLEALGVADKDKDGQLEVTELAAHVASELPEVSYKAFKHRQIPQASISGYSFSLGTPTLVLDQTAQ